MVVSLGIQIPLIQSFPLPRWNFGKANWGNFTKRLDDSVRFMFIKPVIRNYDRFMSLVNHVATQCIPRGFRKEFVPGCVWPKPRSLLHPWFKSKTYSPSRFPEILLLSSPILASLVSPEQFLLPQHTSHPHQVPLQTPGSLGFFVVS